MLPAFRAGALIMVLNDLQRLKAKDMTQAQAAVELGVGIATIKRH